VTLLVKDLSVPSAAEEIFNEVQSRQIEINTLINNAGFGGHGKFYEREWSKDQAMINVNVMALTAVTRYFLPDMITRNYGRILNIASTSGFIPGSLQAVYYASKAFVVSFSEALSEELSDTDITVTALCPGPTETEFIESGELQGVNLFNLKMANTAKFAGIGYRGMLKGKRVVFDQPFLGFILRRVALLMPRKLVLKSSRFVMEKS